MMCIIKAQELNDIIMFIGINYDVHHSGTKINDIIMFIEMPMYREL